MKIVNHSYKPILLGALLLILSFNGCGNSEKIVQPVEYNHAVHIGEAGMECADCHEGVTGKIRATIPQIRKCKSCHSQPKGKGQEEAKVVEAVKTKTEIPWKRIYSLPQHVFFSHRRHVTSGKIPCKTCHGEMSKRTSPPSQPLVPISMAKCMECHDNKSISNDCITCHV